MKSIFNYRLLSFLLLLVASLPAFAEKPVAKKIFFFGDSTTGWLAERLQAYGEKNGFEVATVIWDGATIKKYGNNAEKLHQYVFEANPDAVFVSLGMNEMAAADPKKLLSVSLDKVESAIGTPPVIWIGPVSWPGHANWGPALDTWLNSELGAEHFFSSLALSIPRQSKTNPHPTRGGADKWMDAVVKWIEEGHAAIALPGYAAPSKEFVRPQSYVYKKMSTTL